LSVIESASRGFETDTADISAVDVCICTYHRPALVKTLRSLVYQQGCEGIRMRVVVADNADAPEARVLVEQAAQEFGLDATYVHAPARNISIARNACLDMTKAEWLAFLDDDEIASPCWLSGLIAEARRGQWDVVLGPVQAVYPASAPAWLKAGDFHSTRPVFVRGRIETGYTGNVLIRRQVVESEGLRFRIELGRTGGEDEDFFNRMRDAGARIGFAPRAIVYEAVRHHRMTLSWLLRRSFRYGQTYGGGLRARTPSRYVRTRASAIAAAKAGYCFAAALAHFAVAARRNRFLTRAALHCGVVARLAGWTEVKLY
jgi:succinoglycan biosynthesis protein ExoM